MYPDTPQYLLNHKNKILRKIEIEPYQVIGGRGLKIKVINAHPLSDVI